MDNQCRECGKKCKDATTLHRHLRAHHITQSAYYIKHFPRFDKYDGSPLPFKDRETYFLSDFSSRANFASWLLEATPEEGREYVRNLLLTRKDKKKLTYTPSQVELRTLPLPGMVRMQQLFGDYYKECEKLGFVNKYEGYVFDKTERQFSKEHRILIDTREQMPLHFPTIPTSSETLDFGDYKLDDGAFTGNLVVERKAIGDFYSTLSGYYARFAVELHKAQEAKSNLLILVEGTMKEVEDFSQRLRSRGHMVPSAAYAFHNMRRLIQEMPHIQFLFVEDRDEATEVILKLFKCKPQFSKVDLQYAYDTGNLLVG